MLIYDGDFLNGVYQGKGTLWDSKGNLLYEGGFVEGKYSGTGTLYDVATGKVRQTGQFKNGILIAASEDSQTTNTGNQNNTVQAEGNQAGGVQENNNTETRR